MNEKLVILVLLAAIGHATWHALIKTSCDQFLGLAAMNFFSFSFFLLLLPFVRLPSASLFIVLLLSVSLHVVYKVGLSHIYKHSDFSQALPIVRGVTPLIARFLGLLFFDQLLTITQFFGVIFISLGLIVFSRDKGDRRPTTGLLVLAFSTGLAVALYSVVDAYGVKISGDWFAFTVWLMVLDGGLFVALAAIMKGPGLWRSMLKDPWRPLISAVLGVSGFCIFLWALSHGAVGVVIALRETSILFACLIGVYVLKEKWSVIRAVGAVLVTVGVAALALQR